ncbi:MAG TPA: type II toxin-antitoxin system prevent-host-death family antitoxin [Thermoanaerobaculia bacterium]
MESVGIRELKNRLSHYLREVRRGEVVQVTDRGEVIAELRPPEPQNEHQRELLRRYPKLAELVRSGSIRLGGPNRPEVYKLLPAVLKGITSAELLDQDREEP